MERAKKFRQHRKLYENFHYVEIKPKNVNLLDGRLMKSKVDKENIKKKIVATRSCINCGKLYHGNFHICAANNAVCKKCKKVGHFARVCQFSGRHDNQSLISPLLSNRGFITNKGLKPKNNPGNLKNSNNNSNNKNDKKVLINENDKANLKENFVKKNEADIKAARIEEMREKAAGLYRQKKFKPAFDIYSKIIDESPDDEIHYANRAACYMMTNEYEKALIDAKKSIQLNPKFIKGHVRTIKCLMALGKFIEVELAINTLAELDSSNEELKIEKKKLFTAQNDVKLFDDYFIDTNWELAIKSVDKILKISHHSALYKIKKAECLVKLGKYENAEIITRLILSADEYNIDAKFVLSLCIYQHDADNAVKTLKEVLRVVPDHEKALEVYKKARVLAAKKKEGNDAFKSKYYTKAHKLYSEALRADPDNRGMAKRLYCNLAYASFKRGNLEISIEEATAALLIDPDFVKMLVHRGKLYMHDDNYDLAVKDLSRAYRIESEFEIYGLLQHAKHMQFFMSASKKHNNPSYYDVLGVSKDASDEELKKAYREKAMVHHPDRHSHCSDIEKKIHEKKFQEITQAYRNLTDGEGYVNEPTDGSMHEFMSRFCQEFFAHMFFHT